MKRVLVISPHPDDEAIGCGGTISCHVNNRDVVHVIFLTSGEKGGHGRSAEETIKTRESEAQAAADILKIEQIEFWREPDGNFQASEINISRLVEKIKDYAAEIIYVPHYQEEHPDHKSAVFMVEKSLQCLDGLNPIVYMYEVWTPIQKIDHIVDISPYVEIKRKAIQAHKSQCDVLNFEDAILGLNRYRGEMHSWPGGDYAEIFKRMN